MKNFFKAIISVILVVLISLSITACYFEDGVFHEHTFGDKYRYDETYHWLVPTCGHSARKNIEKHTLDESGVCFCGYSKRYTYGKEHFYVIVYDDVIGFNWLNTMAREFEVMYEDYVFESGRQGVVVHVKNGRADVTGDSITTLINSSNYDIYYTYSNLRELVLEDKLMDITDVVTNTMSDTYKNVWTDLGESTSIENKMESTIKKYYQYLGADENGVVDKNNIKYYGIPLWNKFYNIVYDIELFYDLGLYLKDNGGFCMGVITNGATEEEIDLQKSVGQDGIRFTEDDGLPITYQDWVNLCNKMARLNVYPLYPPNYDFNYLYLGYLTTFWANYEGANDWYINVTGEGEDSEFGTISLAEQNGYLTSGQAGRKASLKFAEDIARNNRLYKVSVNEEGYYNHQASFLRSKYFNETWGHNRVAMIIDTDWWETEAKSIINDMAMNYGNDYVNRRFGVMTIPRIDDGHYSTTKWLDDNGNYTVETDNGKDSKQVNGMTLVSTSPNSNVFIRKNAKHPEIAKLFLAYTTTNKNLKQFTVETGATRPYYYELTNYDLSYLSTYRRQFWSHYTRALNSGEITYTAGAGNFSVNNKDIVLYDYGLCYNGLTVGGTTYRTNNPVQLFKNNANLTVDEYFDAYVNYYSANNGAQWKASFCKNL